MQNIKVVKVLTPSLGKTSQLSRAELVSLLPLAHICMG